MKVETKAKRAVLVLNILKEYYEDPLPLNAWLDLINKKLSSRHSIGNTKELSYVFRYIKRVMRGNIVKQEELCGLKLYVFKSNKDGKRNQCSNN